MIIREAVPADAEPICRLGEGVAEFKVNEQTVAFWPKETLVSAIAARDVLVYVAQQETAIAGFLICSYSDSLHKATVENVFVDDAYRGQGVGNVLLKRVTDALVARGCDYIATLVPPDAQNAIRLYTASGFSTGETFLWLDKTISKDFSAQKSD